MKRRFDVVVCGAGVVGLATAALLARGAQRDALRVTVVDAGEAYEWSSAADVGLRVSAISAGSMRLLASLGIREAIAARECPYRDMHVWDASGEPDSGGTLRFSAADMALPELGFIVEDGLLRQALAATLPAAGVELRYGVAVEAIDTSGPQAVLSLAGGEALAADLVIAADGAGSPLRQALGIDVASWRYAQAALVTHVRPERDHAHTARQRFLATGPLALLPLADGRVSIVWSTTPDEAAELLDADDDEFATRITAASDDVLGQLRPAGPRASFPLRAQHARRYVGRAVALVGDAAHTVHPLAGQGANLGLADAAALERVVGHALERGEHPGDLPVLRRYERDRRGANARMLYFTDGLNRLFAAGGGLPAMLRATGLGLFDRSGPLKRHAMRVALGLDTTGERDRI